MHFRFVSLMYVVAHDLFCTVSNGVCFFCFSFFFFFHSFVIELD